MPVSGCQIRGSPRIERIQHGCTRLLCCPLNLLAVDNRLTSDQNVVSGNALNWIDEWAALQRARGTRSKSDYQNLAFRHNCLIADDSDKMNVPAESK
jgi:hypothetical protein